MLKSSGIRFSSIPNFRLVDQDDDGKLKNNGLPLLYRSSRPDFLTETELSKFNQLGIKSIIDFRSAKEYSKANGNKLLDQYYPVCKIHTNFFGKVNPGNPTYKVLSEDTANTPYGKHYLIDFFKANYIWAVYNRAPLWFRIYSLVYLLFDVIMNTGFKYFVRTFAQKVLNKRGLAGQYLDMLSHSQAAILSALKLLSDPSNLPAMLNCAHGKDRTGIVSAMVLGCLGKSKDYIAKNYAVSSVELGPMKDRLKEEIVTKFHMCTSFTTANYETMMEVLDYIDHTYGSIENYLESIGFKRDDQERLRLNLMAES